MIKSVLKMLPVVVFVMACSSDKNIAKRIDDSDVKVKDKIDNNSSVVVNKKDEVLVKNEVSASGELRKIQFANSKLEADLNVEKSALERCRIDIADERLGGNGQIAEIPAVDNLKNSEDVKQELGITEAGEVKLVSQEFYMQRLDSEKKYGKTLKETVALVKKHRMECESKMGALRVKNGIPAKRYEAKGKYDSKGNWIMERAAEQNLDDAYDLMNKEKSAQ